MGKIKREEIMGIETEDGKVFCHKCMDDDFDLDSVLTERDLDEETILQCDDCGKRLPVIE